LSIAELDGDHRDVLARAITRVLSTDVAEISYAQIVDGLPLADVAYDSSTRAPAEGHPIKDVHKELCPGMLDKT
ncbi:hypothetical protein B0T17DRAFT_461152, partial [Bombardia bombarda]